MSAFQEDLAWLETLLSDSKLYQEEAEDEA
jgi:hypothetical protein